LSALRKAEARGQRNRHPAGSQCRHTDGVVDPWPTWDEWLRSLEEGDRADALVLRDRLAALGAEDAESWARSEVSEGIPQQARFLILRHLWRDAIDAWAAPAALDRLPTAKRLLDAGADRNDLVCVARAAAYEAVFTAMWAIDEGHDPDAPDDCPGWRLMETQPDCHPTGRVVGGLHESFQSMDPSGQEGADLWT
jgi:hypothetical protein